jgi:uncharacterized protein YoxC
MPNALQVAFFLASLAIVILVAWVVPMAFLMRQHLKSLVNSAEQSKSDMQTLVRHSQELIRNVTEILRWASKQMDEVGQVVATVREWTESADHFLKEVGSVVEPSVFTIVRNMNLLRSGVSGFLHALRDSFHRNQSNKIENTP